MTHRPAFVPRITTESIAAARTRIHPEFLDSPQVEHEGLSRAAGARLLCKIEIQSPVGCFKGRGADSFIGTLPNQVKTLVTPLRAISAWLWPTPQSAAELQ
jgi:threonine dehydratase